MHDLSTQPKRRPVLTPRLRWLLRILLAGFGLMVLNSVILSGYTFMSWLTGRPSETLFSIWIFLMHVILGLLLIVPVVVYGIGHLLRGRHSPNVNARRAGYLLLASSLLLLLTGIVLLRIDGVPNPFDKGDARDVVWWAHVLIPLIVIWLFIAHRLVGPGLRWRIGRRWTMATMVVVVAVTLGHFPGGGGALDLENVSLPGAPGAMTAIAGAERISVEELTAIQGCIECHPDAHASWSSSAHRFSSFDNPVYAASVRETRRREPEMSTFCAGCHDPVLLLSGGFDDPRLDDPTIDPETIPGATAGINCLICHSISHVDPFGNGSWTITPPTNYPFHDSTSAPLQWLHRQLMRSRPGFHKASMNRPGVTDSATLCGTCHKAWIPEGLNDHRWLHGQNHYDSWRLSGVSGHGVESWRWPSDPSTDCNGCHMPLRPSDDIAARDRDGSGTPTIHDHLFAAGNTALPVLLDLPDRDRVLAAHERILSESMRVDIVGLREDGRIDGAFIGPLRPELPALEPGSTWLLEVVSRNLGVGHAFTQGTADSNEIWLDLTVRAGERIIGRSGAVDDEGRVDPWAYRLNAFLVDSEGRHVQNRAPETIFTSVYDHQVPPGSATVTHYRLVVPEDVVGPLEIEVAIRYRKFDRALMDFVYGEASGAEMVGRLPAMIVASDDIMLPTTGDGSVDREQPPPAPTWERLYDYGIGLQHAGSRGPLRQAEETFRRVAALGRAEGDFGLARVQLREGRYPEAIEALERLAREPGTVPAWGVTYLSGVADRERGLLEEALVRFRSLADEQSSEYPRATQLGFDFSGDDALLLDIAALELRLSTPDDLDQLGVVLDRCDRVIRRNPQDFRAWWLRAQALTLGGSALDERASNAPIVGAAFPDSLRSLADAEVSGTPGGWERRLHDTFRPDAQARERAVRAARRAYPWVDHAAEPGAIYDLHRTGGLR